MLFDAWFAPRETEAYTPADLNITPKTYKLYPCSTVCKQIVPVLAFDHDILCQLLLVITISELSAHTLNALAFLPPPPPSLTRWTLGTVAEVLLAWSTLHGGAPGSWRVTAALCALPFGSLLLMYPFVPESPKLLMAQGAQAKALALLRRCVGGGGRSLLRRCVGGGAAVPCMYQPSPSGSFPLHRPRLCNGGGVHECIAAVPCTTLSQPQPAVTVGGISLPSYPPAARSAMYVLVL